jgi:hypothetical protein
MADQLDIEEYLAATPPQAPAERVSGDDPIEPTAAQNKRLLTHLREHPIIDPLTAWRVLGIYRLGARVFELRRGGHNIVTERREVPNKFGERCNIAFYKLEENNE